MPLEKKISTKDNIIFFNLERNDGSWKNLKIDEGSCSQISNYIHIHIYSKRIQKTTKVNIAYKHPHNVLSMNAFA